MEKITRFGAYGVIRKGEKVLLVLQKSGVYKGLLHLPGGGIEFGEAPEETLRRELKEEVALGFEKLDLLCVAASTGMYKREGDDCHFHHVGVIYAVAGFSELEGIVPEETSGWYDLKELQKDRLAPFASQVFCKINTRSFLTHEN